MHAVARYCKVAGDGECLRLCLAADTSVRGSEIAFLQMALRFFFRQKKVLTGTTVEDAIQVQELTRQPTVSSCFLGQEMAYRKHLILNTASNLTFFKKMLGKAKCWSTSIPTGVQSDSMCTNVHPMTKLESKKEVESRRGSHRGGGQLERYVSLYLSYPFPLILKRAPPVPLI